MPIKIPNDLPARPVLEAEGIDLIPESIALKQDIRPLQVLILNLMPDKITTETQLLRALGHTPLQIEITLLRTSTYEGKNTSKDHLLAFYQTFDEIRDRKFDAFVVTGAPVEQMKFEDVDYWPELTKIFDWSRSHVFSTLFICWGAMAALYYDYGIPKYPVSRKQFGLFPHKVSELVTPLTAGFDDIMLVPVSRHSEIRDEDVAKIPGLDILIHSQDAGICLLQDIARKRFFMLNHLEYDLKTLQQEYARDFSAGLEIPLPFNYFPGDNPEALPPMSWRAHRHLLFGNWLGFVYQGTPYDLSELEQIP